MTYAQILNNVIVNIIVIQDTSVLPIFTKGFDTCVLLPQVSNVQGIFSTEMQPTIGWSYDGKNFTAPPPTTGS